MATYIRHPKSKILINLDLYADIRLAANETDLNLYRSHYLDDTPQEPDTVITFDNAKARSYYFYLIVKAVSVLDNGK